ncbi:hypothetical protein GCM10010275_17790 [Streptomyces litmocidini]|nr:hypothetical protein GCM10010275_17790 [Streptomyces litmocidini]
MSAPIAPHARPHASGKEAPDERPAGARQDGARPRPAPSPTSPALPVTGPGGTPSNGLRARGRSRGPDVPDRGRPAGELPHAGERATEEAGKRVA